MTLVLPQGPLEQLMEAILIAANELVDEKSLRIGGPSMLTERPDTWEQAAYAAVSAVMGEPVGSATGEPVYPAGGDYGIKVV